jgi:hypothetical protein
VLEVEVITPALEIGFPEASKMSVLLVGGRKFGWFRMLKTSARN